MKRRRRSIAAWISSFTFCCCCVFPTARDDARVAPAAQDKKVEAQDQKPAKSPKKIETATPADPKVAEIGNAFLTDKDSAKKYLETTVEITGYIHTAAQDKYNKDEFFVVLETMDSKFVVIAEFGQELGDYVLELKKRQKITLRGTIHKITSPDKKYVTIDVDGEDIVVKGKSSIEDLAKRTAERISAEERAKADAEEAERRATQAKADAAKALLERISLNTLAKLQKGMSYTDVRRILGEPTTKKDIGSASLATWSDGASDPTIITLSFQNLELASKSIRGPRAKSP